MKMFGGIILTPSEHTLLCSQPFSGCKHLPPHKASACAQLPCFESAVLVDLSEISVPKSCQLRPKMVSLWEAASLSNPFSLCPYLEGRNHALSLRAALYFGGSNDISPHFFSDVLNILFFFSKVHDKTRTALSRHCFHCYLPNQNQMDWCWCFFANNCINMSAYLKHLR